MRTKWTHDEETFLKDNYPQNGYAFCAKALDKDISTVITKVKNMKLNRIGLTITDEQKDFVLNNYKQLSISEICTHCQLTHCQVYSLLARNGIKLADWSQFSAEDEKTIRDNLNELSNAEIGLMLNRTADSIHAKLQLMNLRRTPAAIVKIRRNSGGQSYFPKGNLPYNTKTDGEISIRTTHGTSYKHIRISIAYWIPLQIFNWEQVNGPLPDGMVLRCLSDDTMDCKPNNWELISKTEHLEKNAGRDTLEDKYITRVLAHKNKELRPLFAQMPEMIELKRSQLKMRKTINELT